MKPLVTDEMFPEAGDANMEYEESTGSGDILMDLAANGKLVHGDFYNDFGDLFDDEDLQ